MNLRGLKFMKSRIPALDALAVYVANGHEKDEIVLKTSSERGFSRWIPVNGGHKVLFLYEGGMFNEKVFSVEKGAWDHEHCKECGGNISAMTLCWVTESGPFVILCSMCYEQLLGKE